VRFRDDSDVRALAVAVTVALVAPATALAHVDVSPGLLVSGREVELQVELPELRPDATPAELDVSGPGVRQLSSEAAGRAGEETRWRVRVLVTAAPGPTTLLLRARFDDGGSVEVRRAVTVVPAGADDGSGVPVAAVAAALVALGALLGAAVLLRRRAASS
jgi:hypothetical protein